MLDPQGPYAKGPDDLFMFVFWIAVVVFVLVQGLIIYTSGSSAQRRRRRRTLPVQTHGNTKLEIFWTVIPALILAGIAVPTVQQIFDLAEEPRAP
jgi:cytochrome c oxidase subunit II